MFSMKGQVLACDDRNAMKIDACLYRDQVRDPDYDINNRKLS